MTAILTIEQVCAVHQAINPNTPAIVSIFAGRIADTGLDPMPIMRGAKRILASRPSAELLWASCREALNVKQAATAGCHIIAVTHDILRKVPLFGKCLTELSVETVQMFYRDATAAGFRL